MNKKGFGIIALVAVAIAAFVVGGFVINNLVVAQSPGSLSKAFINAHECTADGVCETNNLDVGNILKFISFELQNRTGYLCVNPDGEVIKSPIACNARISQVCKQLDEQVVTTTIELSVDGGREVILKESEQVFESEHLVVPSNLLKVQQISNSSAGFDNDVVEFRDILTNDVYIAIITAEGVGTVDIGGNTYQLTYHDVPEIEDDEYVILDYPQAGGDDKIDLSLCF